MKIQVGPGELKPTRPPSVSLPHTQNRLLRRLYRRSSPRRRAKTSPHTALQECSVQEGVRLGTFLREGQGLQNHRFSGVWCCLSFSRGESCPPSTPGSPYCWSGSLGSVTWNLPDRTTFVLQTTKAASLLGGGGSSGSSPVPSWLLSQSPPQP